MLIRTTRATCADARSSRAEKGYKHILWAVKSPMSERLSTFQDRVSGLLFVGAVGVQPAGKSEGFA